MVSLAVWRRPVVLQPLQGRRIAVIGQSGSGKSTLARTLSARTGLPHIELDALNWGPGWRALSLEDPDRWARAVAQAVTGDGWITDGNYSTGARPVILPRATDVVWLDLSRGVILRRVLGRSFARALTGRELWPGTGNRESFRRWLQPDHPIRWTWDTHRAANARRAAMFEGADLAHLRRDRLRSPAEVARWLDAVTCPDAAQTPPAPPRPAGTAG